VFAEKQVSLNLKWIELAGRLETKWLHLWQRALLMYMLTISVTTNHFPLICIMHKDGCQRAHFRGGCCVGMGGVLSILKSKVLVEGVEGME
jgi:hypothetical protein